MDMNETSDKRANKEQNGFAASIREIANWEHDGIVEIPALQRGLVWAPHQVELLWDSILRGFPIGAFALTPVQGNEGQLTAGEGEGMAQYFLLDGQQRYNAIRAAFVPWSNEAKAVLWLDFMPPTQAGSTRRFWVKVTTKAHPWGFANNDNCSVLGWNTYRAALERFTGSEDTRIQDVRMSTAWPFMARCPVPFAVVLDAFDKAGVSGTEVFCKDIADWCTRHGEVGNSERNPELIERTARMFFAALARMQGYRIVANILDPGSLCDPSPVGDGSPEDEGTNSLEQLFTRINTLGTPISPYDLRYSAIKAYWGGIKNANDDIAGTIMPAAHLAILAFRLALTLASEKKGFADTPSVQRIRQLKTKEDEESRAARRFVNELYADGGARLRGLIDGVETALRVFKNEDDVPEGLPAVLRTSIILNSPDVYLLLLYMARKGRLGDFGNLVGLATWLHWLSVGAQKVAVDAIKEAVDGGDLVSLKAILRTLCENNSLLEPVAAEDGNFLCPTKFLTGDGKAPNWTPFENEPWYPLFNKMWSQRELVIFATRRYFNREFRYDPAETKFLTGHNRPWDIDHIVPRSWAARQGKEMGEWKDICREWIWSNGNYAAIPFTMNRSKRDRSDWNYYTDATRKGDLFFDDAFTGLESDTITSNHDMAMTLVRTIHRRLVAMYEEWRREVVGYL